MNFISLELITTGILQGLLLALVAIGIMIPFKILNFADLTSEGSYPLGGALTASLLIFGIDPYTATIAATLLGGFMGIGTALIHWYLKINTLLAGIILSTMMYSINLRLMGQPNSPLFENWTLFSSIAESITPKIAVLLTIVLFIISILCLFMLTEKGLQLRAVGLNPAFAERQGINRFRYVLLGLFAGNALSGLAGSLMVQIQAYADVGMGVGIVIHGLAALMIGESIIGTQTLLRQISAPLCGALIYQQIQGLVIHLGLAPSDLKLITGIIVLLTLGYKHLLLKQKDAL